MQAKRVTNCGSCGKWYRATRMYRTFFSGIEKTMNGMIEKKVDEERFMCPECYSRAGYKVGRHEAELPETDEVEFICDSRYVKPNDFRRIEKIKITDNEDSSQKVVYLSEEPLFITPFQK